MNPTARRLTNPSALQGAQDLVGSLVDRCGPIGHRGARCPRRDVNCSLDPPRSPCPRRISAPADEPLVGEGMPRRRFGQRGEGNGAARAPSQRQSRSRGRDGAFLSKLRGDRERKDPDRNVQRGTTRETAPDAECLLRGLWQRTLPDEMRPPANPARHAGEAATHAEIRGIPLLCWHRRARVPISRTAPREARRGQPRPRGARGGSPAGATGGTDS